MVLQVMFTVEERDHARDRILEMAQADRRLVAGALIGSTATGSDRWSDLDLTFGVADQVDVSDVLADWTARLQREFQAVHLFDVSSQSTVYRVFLLPGNLQVDLSFTPRVEFGARGPNFTLVFGTAVKNRETTQPSPEHLFGLAVHHLVRARICIERNRLWQAEYWISAARDYALSLACHHRGLNTSYGRGYDDLSREVLKSFADTLVFSLDREGLLRALAKTTEELFRNSQDAHGLASKLEGRLHELNSKIQA
jgi:hypothetical protein